MSLKIQSPLKENDAEGEMMELDEERADVVDTEDGGALVTLEDQVEDMIEAEHFANLAETLDSYIVTTTGTELIELIEDDIKSREERDKLYAEGLRRTGLGDDAPGGADFKGASKVVHPMLTEVCVDFSARVMKELFPAAGPVKQHIPGTITKDKVEKSKRKAAFMNWQLTKQIREFRSELEQTLTQVPLGGAAYLKVFYDERGRRPSVEFIPIDDVIYPCAASSFMNAERKTHRRKITELKYKRLVESGVYRDVDVITPEQPETTASEEASNKIEGKQLDAQNNDGIRTIFECSCYLDLEEEGNFDPYLVTIDLTTRQVLAIYRNWEPDDDKREELQHIVEFPFVPWRGAAPIGITHMIGSISGAATGALRALLDSAHISNSPSAFKLKGGIKGGQAINAKPTEIKEIEGSVNTDDIRKLIMPMPFNPPSPVLMELLGFLVEQGKGVIRTTFEDLPNQRTDAPVGTTLALIEQGLTVFSAIHSRLHSAMGQVLEIVHRINSKHFNPADIKEDLGEMLAKPADFQGPMDVIPVSDPNIFSEVQRQAQIALIAQRAALLPQLYNLNRVEKLILEYAKIPAPEELLNPVPDPVRDNAVNENVKAAMGQPLVAFPEQDHEAHIMTHLAFMMHPIFGQNPSIVNGLMPIMVSHLRDHIALWYVSQVVDLASQAAGQDFTELMDKDEVVSKEVDRALAIASQQVLMQASASPLMSEQLPTIMQQAMQFVQKNQPPTPVDPSAVQMQEVQRKAAADQQKAQIEQQRLAIDQQQAQLEQQRMQFEAQRSQSEAQRAQMEAQMAQQEAALRQQEQKLKMAEQQMRMRLEQEKLQQKAAADARKVQLDQAKLAQTGEIENLRQQNENARTDADIAARVEMNNSDNETAMLITAAEIESGEKASHSTGTGINPGN
jgi:hypothetical protein